MSDYSQGRSDERRDVMALLREAIANRPEHEATLRDVMLAIASGAHDTGGGYVDAIDYRAAFGSAAGFVVGGATAFPCAWQNGGWVVRYETNTGKSAHECPDREAAYRRACELAGVKWKVKR